MQDVGFDFPDNSSSGPLVYVLCAGAVALVFLGRRIKHPDRPYRWVCYAFAIALVLLAWGILSAPVRW